MVFGRFLLYVVLLGPHFMGFAQDGILQTDYNQYEITVSNISMVIDGNKGARIASFKWGDQEVMGTDKIHPRFYGSTLWLSPEGKWKGQGALDNGSYTLVYKDASALALLSKPSDEPGFQFFKKFWINKRDTSITVEYTIKNISEKVQEVAPWEVTRVPTGGLAIIPKRSTDDVPWPNKVYRVPPTIDSNGIIWYPYDSDKEVPQKLFMDSGNGWMAYAKDNVLFIKSFPIVDKDDYAPGESNVELYVNKEKTYVELENQGPYQSLNNNESLIYQVKWYVRPLPSNLRIETGNMNLISYVEEILNIKTPSSSQKDIEKVTALLTETMLNPDEDTLNSLFSDQLSYGHSGGLIENKEQIINGLTKGPFRFLTINISDQNIKLEGNVALVRQVLTTDYSENGVKGTYRFGILLVWHQERGHWRLLARQAIKI